MNLNAQFEACVGSCYIFSLGYQMYINNLLISSIEIRLHTDQ